MKINMKTRPSQKERNKNGSQVFRLLAFKV